jgi:hypothetical protein
MLFAALRSAQSSCPHDRQRNVSRSGRLPLAGAGSGNTAARLSAVRSSTFNGYNVPGMFASEILPPRWKSASNPDLKEGVCGVQEDQSSFEC